MFAFLKNSEYSKENFALHPRIIMTKYRNSRQNGRQSWCKAELDRIFRQNVPFDV